ncbi:MAG TPA: YggS family pyridoxal phosphate-dependent enzyme [Usitatibacteraceae bacterium]|nr:YggS family pyridoxal phosphate-dependent enzyme [Usitatibacteraceae bacterium]
MSPIAENLQGMRRRISEALQGDGRAVTLVAVSKTHPPGLVREAFAAGQRDFGENYVQEAVAKIGALADLPATWHFIGALQGNKAKEVARHFDWVHGVDRARIADLLSRHRPAGKPPLNVCVEVNISEEATKGGVKPGEALALARHVASLPGLRFRGLMGMASPSGDEAKARAEFTVLRRELEAIRAAGLAGDTLSMGMTHDYRAALAEGATMLRLGTAIFGAREAQPWREQQA